MHPDKVAFLFGTLPAWADPDDPDERTELVSREVDEDAPGAIIQLALRLAVADQIANDDPPQVWATAQRLSGEGLDRHDVLKQLVLAFTPQLMSALQEHQPFDRKHYVSALDRLPLPSSEHCERALLEVAMARPSSPLAELDGLVATRLGLGVDDPVGALLVDQVSEQVLDPDGPLELLAGQRVVHVEALTDGMVLTHRLHESERASSVLPVGADLSGFRRRRKLSLTDGQAITVTEESWTGPPGWLADIPADSLLAIRIDDNVLSVTPLEVEPAVSTRLVALLRAGYDEALHEPWLPVPVEELVLDALLADPSAFATPAAPLTQLLDAAGLEVRGAEVAHEDSVWQSVAALRRTARLLTQLGSEELTGTVVHVLDLIDRLGAGPPDAQTARHMLDDLYDPVVLEVVTNELLSVDDDSGQLETTGALARRLMAAASRPAQRAVAHWLTAVVAEREGRVAAAETQLRAAVRLDPDWECAAARLAWYCSDRGSAEAALTLWRGVGADSANSEDISLLESFAVSPDGPRLGRNDRCWCGSGRKFKQCHLGQVVLPPLPERVGWLCRKATAYLERRGGSLKEVIYEHAYVRALDPDDEDSILEALEDPLVNDVVLHESGWFDRFLAERGALLPEDEALLAGAWTLVDRTIYELLEVRAGVGVKVRDLRTGEVFDVRERTFSAAATPGTLVCGRAVPDGESHQFIGGLFGVAPGREGALLDLLDEGDGLALLAYVADLHQPPVIVGPDGQVIDIGDLGPRELPGDAVPALSATIRRSSRRCWSSWNATSSGGAKSRCRRWAESRRSRPRPTRRAETH